MGIYKGKLKRLSGNVRSLVRKKKRKGKTNGTTVHNPSDRGRTGDERGEQHNPGTAGPES